MSLVEILGMCENEDLYSLKTRFYTTVECKNAYQNKFGKAGTYDLNASGVSKVNILGGDLIRNEYFSDLYPTVVGCKFKRSYYVLFEDLSEKCKDWLSEDNTEMTVLVHSGFDQKQIMRQAIISGALVAADCLTVSKQNNEAAF